MSSPGEVTAPAMRRVRKSIGAHPNVRTAMDKENATVDIASELAASRKARSKSIGPGGLDSLRPGTGNRRASIAAPRSILKPRMSVLPEIPSLTPANRTSTGSDDTIRRRSPRRSPRSDFTASKITLRTEEEQQAAAREREEQDRRDARRKSLANRRVSFAAEATLHTFHEIDMLDSTMSTTHSSRRSSNVAGSQYLPTPQQPRNTVFSSTGYQEDDEESVTSILFSDESDPADGIEEVEDAEEEEDLSNCDSDDGTMMTVDIEDVTGTTIASDRSTGSGDESSTLEEALRLAAEHAGTQRLDEDYYDEAAEEDQEEAEEIIPSFGWIKKDTQKQNTGTSALSVSASRPSYPTDNITTSGMEMDMTHNMGRIIKPNKMAESDGEVEMSMDVTKVLGGILAAQSPESSPLREVPDYTRDEATMQFTTTIGDIRSTSHNDTAEDFAADEDMSMEFTMAMGGVLGNEKRKSNGAAWRRTLNRLDEADATMDMTSNVGRILSQKIHPGGEDSAEEDEDEVTAGMDITTDMEMTQAIGGILNSQAQRILARDVMVEEGNEPNRPETAISKCISKQPQRRRSSRNAASESPNRDSGLLPLRRKPPNPEDQITPRPARKSTSPRKQRTPQSTEPTKRQTHVSRRQSPQRVTSTRRHSARASTESPANSPTKPSTNATPVPYNRPEPTTQRSSNHVTPQGRPVSGVVADRNGLGSPRIAEVFDRRSSIGESASKFVPGNRLVSFGDPRVMSKEIDDERILEEEKERTIPQLGFPPEDKDATLNLREMIDRLSPFRKPLNGRKSLHVGSARGILGKRPAELDDEDAEVNDGVKRLRGHQDSPVKNVKMRQPTKTDIISGDVAGFRGRIAAPSLQHSFSSPLKSAQANTPHKQALFDMNANHTVHGTNLESPAQIRSAEDQGDGIHLQEFLNMISIRFMELQTTKRRHTTAPGTVRDGRTADDDDEMSLERCVVASACTVPMLELYQHSCRELKKYIAEGRRMVKEIEVDTFEDNPPLFQEYISATPDVKASMDNEFKNAKTHARLLSKAMWYEWRTKLQEGLREGLVKISSDMDDDYKTLQEQMDMLVSVLPELTESYAGLEEECEILKEAAQEIAKCDPRELELARQTLASLDADIATKKELVATLRQQYQATEASTIALSTKKDICLADMAQSEKIRESCRGWSSSEVTSLKREKYSTIAVYLIADQLTGRVKALEKKLGWAVTGVSGTTLSMAYRREIEIVLDVTSFQKGSANSQIDLWYIADCREKDPLPRTVEKDFFLQCIRDYVRALHQSSTRIPELLSIVQQAWDRATNVSSQLRHVNSTFPTKVRKTSDSSIEMVTSLLVVPLHTRVQVTLKFQNQSIKKGLDMNIASSVAVVYGEHFNVNKIGEFLTSRIGKQMGAIEENWSGIFVELHRRLIARGRK